MDKTIYQKIIVVKYPAFQGYPSGMKAVSFVSQKRNIITALILMYACKHCRDGK